MLEKILVPIDFSPPSLQTLRYAKGVAQRFGARVYLVHVIDFAPLAPQRILPPAFRTDMARSATKRLKELAAQFSLPPHKDSLKVVTGRTGDEITKVARKTHADLIVIATRGYSGLKYAFFGSTAENVVREAPCPVLILRAGQDAPKTRTLQVRKIVVPVDFSENAAIGVNYALQFAQPFKAEVILFHALSTQSYFIGDHYLAQALPPPVPESSKHAQSEMAKLSKKAAKKGHAVRTQLALGSPVEQLARYVEREKVGMVIMSTHRRRGLSRLFMGTRGEQIARYVSCSVLVVPNRRR